LWQRITEISAGMNIEPLPVLSDTRWLTRVDSIDCLLKRYRAVCEAVEAVSFFHLPEC